MITYTDREIDPANIKPEDIDELDVAVSLSRINRFVGHTAFPYSVAQHCLFVCSLVKKGYHESYHSLYPHKLTINDINLRRLQLFALGHDADEYVTNDIPSPVKQLLKPSITEVEKPIMLAFWKAMGEEPPTEDEKNYIKSLDIKAYNIEEKQLRNRGFEEIEDPWHFDKCTNGMESLDPNLVALTYLRKLKQLRKRHE